MIIDRNISSSSGSATIYNVEQDCVLNIHAALNASSPSLLSINNVVMGRGSNQYVYIDITGEPCKAGTKISVTNGNARISGFTLE